MQPMTRLSRKELVELIEATEAAGNDATELRNFLAQLPDEGRPRPPARQGGGRAALEEEEPLRDRLRPFLSSDVDLGQYFKLFCLAQSSHS